MATGAPLQTPLSSSRVKKSIFPNPPLQFPTSSPTHARAGSKKPSCLAMPEVSPRACGPWLTSGIAVIMRRVVGHWLDL